MGREETAWNVIHSSKSHEWRTPPLLFEWLDREFRFTLDAAATPGNALCEAFLTKKDNALTKDWAKLKGPGGTLPTVFVNPPYGRGIGDWIDKAGEEQKEGCTTVMVVSACTDTLWWRDAWARVSEVRLLTGRVRFLDAIGNEVNSAPKGTAVLVWRPFGGWDKALEYAGRGGPLVTLVEPPALGLVRGKVR